MLGCCASIDAQHWINCIPRPRGLEVSGGEAIRFLGEWDVSTLACPRDLYELRDPDFGEL